MNFNLYDQLLPACKAIITFNYLKAILTLPKNTSEHQCSSIFDAVLGLTECAWREGGRNRDVVGGLQRSVQLGRVHMLQSQVTFPLKHELLFISILWSPQKRLRHDRGEENKKHNTILPTCASPSRMPCSHLRTIIIYTIINVRLDGGADREYCTRNTNNYQSSLNICDGSR